MVAPGTPEDAKGLLKAAIRSDDPVLFIENATVYQQRGEVPDGDYTTPIGKSKVQREGKDVTLVTYSKMVPYSMKAAEQLAKEGIEVEIVDLRSLRPLDMGPGDRVLQAHQPRGDRGGRLEILRRGRRSHRSYL